MRAANLWWLHPSRVVVLALLPLYASILAFDFAAVVKNVYIPGWHYAWGFVMLLCLPVGIQCALAHERSKVVVPAPRISRSAMLLLFVVALLAYAIWFGPLAADPQALIDIALGRRMEVRGAVTTLPGVTTLTQFGVVYAIAYGVKLGAPQQPVSRLEHAGFAVLLLLTTFRAFAWAERLAVFEFLVCFAIARLATLNLERPRLRRWVSAAPWVAVPLVYLAFTTSEYFRSWEYYADQYDSIWAFGFDRIITYYATAANNGIGILHDDRGWPYYNGAFAFKFAWTMPGLAGVLDQAFGSSRGIEEVWLDVHARSEFNSPTAYFRVLLDFGYFGSVVYFVILGYVIGRAYRAWRCQRAFGLLAYPVFFLFLIESLRYNYLAESRVVPLALGLGSGALDIRRLRRTHARERRASLTAGDTAAATR
jgi:oligosaccharide repeat unit polymerase